MKIPKIIHYCWFGNNALTDLSKRCVESWSKTGCEIMLWNEGNIEFNDYLTKCRNSKKYANMSNFWRMVVLDKYGGVYLDTDVEVLKTLDCLLDSEMFLGWEDNDYINNAVWGSSKSHCFLKKCISEFNFDGSEMANESSPHFLTRMIKREYNMGVGGTNQTFDNLSLYSREYFYPYSWKEKFNPNCVTQNTVTIHRWEKKWG